MPNFENWLGVVPAYLKPSAAVRAAAAWKRINDRPTSLVIRRSGVKLTAQTMRVEWENIGRELPITQTENAVTIRRAVTVFGVKGHPTIANSDIREGDQFGIDGDIYVVEDIITPPGEIQATCYRLE